MEHEDLTRRILGCAMRVHGALGPGFLELVYQNALAHEMRKAGLCVECEKHLQVTYDGVVVGEYFADMVVGGCVLIENKATQTIAPAHEVQLVNYLTATGIEIGLLLNFGASRLAFKRKTRVYQTRKSRQDEQDRQDEIPATSSVMHPENPAHPV